MNAKITYRVGSQPHPWDEKARAKGVTAMCLIKVITADFGPMREEPVAIFNWDSEAEMFMGHIFAAGLDGKLVTIDSDYRKLFEYRAKILSKEPK
jgi:hypothetical protein